MELKIKKADIKLMRRIFNDGWMDFTNAPGGLAIAGDLVKQCLLIETEDADGVFTLTEAAHDLMVAHHATNE